MRQIGQLFVIGLCCVGMTGCANLAAVEPIMYPPKELRTDTVGTVEFVHPAKVNLRCAERGATFLGLPSFNSGACADTEVMTIPNPCYVINGGWYARLLCHEMAHLNGWPSNHEGGNYLPSKPIQPASQSPEAKRATEPHTH
ncbi:MAG: hypothetical protein AAF986_09370 [Pseudomonadota bacterium]